MRITIRLNELDRAELDLFKIKFGLEKDSEALKLSLKWVNHYIKNVSETFFPPEYNIILTRKLKTNPLDRKIF